MSALLRFVAGLFTGGGAIGGAINTVSLVAVLAPLAIWFLGAKDEIAVSLTWGHLALFFALLWPVLSALRRAPPPAPRQPPYPLS